MRAVWYSSGPSSNVRAATGRSVRTLLIEPSSGWTGREATLNPVRTARRRLLPVIGPESWSYGDRSPELIQGTFGSPRVLPRPHSAFRLVRFPPRRGSLRDLLTLCGGTSRPHRLEHDRPLRTPYSGALCPDRDHLRGSPVRPADAHETGAKLTSGIFCEVGSVHGRRVVGRRRSGQAWSISAS